MNESVCCFHSNWYKKLLKYCVPQPDVLPVLTNTLQQIIYIEKEYETFNYDRSLYYEGQQS